MSCAYLACDKLSMGEWLGNHLNILQWLIQYTTGESSTAPLPQPSQASPCMAVLHALPPSKHRHIHVLCTAATNQTQTTCTRALYMIQKDKLAKLRGGTGFYGNHTLPNALNTTSQGPQCITMKGPHLTNLKSTACTFILLYMSTVLQNSTSLTTEHSQLARCQLTLKYFVDPIIMASIKWDRNQSTNGAYHIMLLTEVDLNA